MRDEIREKPVTIDGKALSIGQVMTIRVALNNFMLDLQKPDALGDDEHGRAMTAAYRVRASELLYLLM